MDGKGERRCEVDAAIQTTGICENTRKHSPTISPFPGSSLTARLF